MPMQWKSIVTAAAAAVFVLSAGEYSIAQPTGIKNIVLVHGAWADGSGWRGIYDYLKQDGYTVSVVQNPLTSLADDVAAVDRVLARQDGPVILVGHSYGGAVITEAGDDPRVAGLVYVQAFAPDVGESVFGLIPKDGPQPPLEPSADGFAFFASAAFLPGFADSVDPALAEFMRDSQVPAAIETGTTPLTVAAWKDKPSWYQVGDADHVIPPPAQRLMAGRAKATVVEVKGGHLAFMANARATADLVEMAAKDAAD
jgi:pimeloyl-ACP methyl ester carboxylesterase